MLDEQLRFVDSDGHGFDPADVGRRQGGGADEWFEYLGKPTSAAYPRSPLKVEEITLNFAGHLLSEWKRPISM